MTARQLRDQLNKLSEKQLDLPIVRMQIMAYTNDEEYHQATRLVEENGYVHDIDDYDKYIKMKYLLLD
jgi:hypothetical protein